MEKRLVIFLIISFAIVAVYPLFLKRFGIEGPRSSGPPLKSETAAVGPKTERPAEREMKDGAGVEIETDLYRILLSSKSGTIQRFELKKYSQTLGGDAKRIELVPSLTEKEFILPLSLTSDLDQEYRVKRVGDNRVEFIGKRATKVYQFESGEYSFSLSVQTEQKEDFFLGTNFGMSGVKESQFVGFIGVVSSLDGHLVKDPIAKLQGEAIHSGRPAWVSIQDKYFISALIPQEPVEGVTAKRTGEGITAGIPLPAGAMRTFHVYAGPKELDRLRSLGVGLDETIDFGWFIFGSWGLVRAVAKPLFLILKWTQTFVRNWGVAIIFVTVLIKLLFFPIMQKSLKSMRAMGELQPKLQALRKKYQNEKERLNREMLALYREHGVNPLSGCLPVLVQIPVFIALFNILYNTIELRHAPFVLWIRDLSAKDPYYVLPILFGVTAYFQQRLQPSTMDPDQQKMMQFLPAVYTFFFLNFPSGLVLYWFVSNLLSIAQQIWMNRTLSSEPARAR